MRFDQIPQHNQITAIDSATQQEQQFPSTGIVNGMRFTVPFARNPQTLGASGAGHRIGPGTPGQAVFIPNAARNDQEVLRAVQTF